MFAWCGGVHHSYSMYGNIPHVDTLHSVHGGVCVVQFNIEQYIILHYLINMGQCNTYLQSYLFMFLHMRTQLRSSCVHYTVHTCVYTHTHAYTQDS